MKYRNTKTGAIIDVESKISGGNWQVLEPATPPVSTSTGKKEGEKDAVRNSRRRKKSVETIDTI